ncbi:MAG TPA: response regulator transcription factor [Polyangiaceae bacterium]|jgi:two-component system phosphate regulon response regulator PhoB
MQTADAESAAPASAERVVVVEDEEDLRGLLVLTLRAAGWNTHSAATGAEGLALVASVRPAVVLLDLMLPDMSGVEACRQLRSDPTNRLLGILVVTARSEEYDRILAFEAGADDYVVKPFSTRELALRVRALGRIRPRANDGDAGDAFRWRGLELDPLRHRVRADGVELGLRPIEFKILLLLLSSPGRAFTRVEVAASVWEGPRDASLRTIDTHVSRLRDVLGPYATAVETVPGVGYRLGDPGGTTPGSSLPP